MNRKSLENRVQDAILSCIRNEHGQVPAEDALLLLVNRKESQLARDFGIGSMDCIDLITALEAEFGIDLDLEMFHPASTVGDVITVVREAVQAKEVAAGKHLRLVQPY